MGKTLQDLLRERPGNPERRARFKAEMLEAIRQTKIDDASRGDGDRRSAEDPRTSAASPQH